MIDCLLWNNKIILHHVRKSLLANTTTSKSPILVGSNNKTPVTSKNTSKNSKQTNDDSIGFDEIYNLLQNLQQSVSSIQMELASYREIVTNLTEQNISLRNENVELKHRVDNIENQIEDMKQSHLNNNILICGVPEADKENLLSIVDTIGNTVGISVNSADICNVYRKKLPSNNSSGLPAPIVVHFSNTKMRNSILAASKTKQFDSHILPSELQHPKRPIYLNEQLTRRKQFLFREARQMKRDGIVQYAWTKNGEIYVRKNEGSPHVKFKNIDQRNDFN